MIARKHAKIIIGWLQGRSVKYFDKISETWEPVTNPSFSAFVDYMFDLTRDFNFEKTNGINSSEETKTNEVDNSFINLKQKIIIDIAKGINTRFYLTQYQSSKFSVRCWNETHESTQKQIEQKKKSFLLVGQY
jgi:hypothetical protein